MFKLVIQDDEGKTTVVPLIRDEITIGRKEGNTIRLTERNVSRRHARILRSNNEVQIEDLGSYNGIRVNNARIAERVSLRISDQVQIGDYKLYLKAEGVEQVDDARTMPIERIENVGPTEVMPAVSGTSPTPPSAIPATPAPPASRQLGVADTDPAGRPVATQAQVAALTTSTGYGKLVVLSANFAGKEFELTRPQMIVGRTDENDMVVNHRSISRNHAKITRDPDTQRYTISDLQSSNGVRVNGQDYGKVELRRGDVVDLGHVRLRFVEPGEDFVFARDATTSDVEGTGGKKTTTIAILLAVVVIGAIVAYFALKGGGGGGDKSGSNNPVGSDQLVATPGSGSSGPLIAEAIDAGAAVQIDPNDEGKRVSAECDALTADKNWTSVSVCADKLRQYDPAKADELKKRVAAETKWDAIRGRVEQAIKEGNLSAARSLSAGIPDDSAIKKDVVAEVDQFEDREIDKMVRTATANKAANKCRDNDVLIGQAAKLSPKAGDAVRAFKCTVAAPPPEDCFTALRNDTKACRTQFCSKNPDNAKCTQATVQQPACDADAGVSQGTAEVARGNHAQALQLFDAALRCKFDAHTLALSFMAACNASKIDYARRYWKKMSPDAQSRYVQICLHNHITAEALNQ